MVSIQLSFSLARLGQDRLGQISKIMLCYLAQFQLGWVTSGYIQLLMLCLLNLSLIERTGLFGRDQLKIESLNLLWNMFIIIHLKQWFPTFLRLGSTYKSKTNLGSTMMAYINFWEHLLVSSWEQFEENSRHLGIFGST